MNLWSRNVALSLVSAWLACAPAAAETAMPAAASVATLDAYFDSVENAAPSAPLGAEEDYRAFAQSLGDRAAVTFGSFTGEGAGAVARDVVLSFGAEKDAGIQVGELRLYAGGKAAKGDIAVARIDARNIKSFGLEAIIEKSAKLYQGSVGDGGESPGGETPDAGLKAALQAKPTIEAYGIGIDRIVIDGLVIHAPNKGAPAGLDDLGALLRLTSSMSRATSARAIAARGVTAEISSRSDAVTSRMTMSVPFYGLRGVARGDMESLLLTGLRFSMDGETAAADGAPRVPVAMEGGVERYTVTGLRLAKLLDYWSRGESPPPKEADLLSLGVWESWNERYTLGGQPLYSLDYARTDLTKFRWFLPTEIRSTVNNLTYDLGGLLRFSQSAAPQAEGAQNLAQLVSLLDKHGFSKISASGDFAYDWAPATGAARLLSKNQMKTLGRLDIDAKSGLPTFKEFASLHPKKGQAADLTKLSPLFANATLQGMSVTVVDAGMLPRLFALAADMQSVQLGGAPGAIKAEELRAGAAFSLRTLGAAPTPLAPVYGAFADFVAEGGTLNIAASPAAPIPLSLILAPGPNGEDPLTRLNVTARRTQN